MQIAFIGGPLNGKTRRPADAIIRARRPEYYFQLEQDRPHGPIHEYRIEWRNGVAEYVGCDSPRPAKVTVTVTEPKG